MILNNQLTAELKRYRELKEVANSWLDKLPSHWEMRRLKHLFREVDRRTTTGAEKLLSLRMQAGLVGHLDAGGKPIEPSDLVGFKKIAPGQLVMNRMRAASGLFGVAAEPGLVSPDYAVFDPIGTTNFAFFLYLFKTPILGAVFRTESKGLGTGDAGFLRLYTDRFGNIAVPLPPIEEQAAIVRFLDHADRRIRKYIAAKRKLIALLNEQKQAIIQRAVTRGLEPNVRLKPSGIDWLGDIPGHWTVSRLKFEASDIVDCLHATPDYKEDGEHPAIRTADIEPGKVRLPKARRIDRAQYERWTARLTPKEGDVLYSREGERFGIAALVPPDVELCISQRMIIIRTRSSQDSEYIMWQLNCRHVYAQAAADVIGSTSPHVNVERIRNYLIALPPKDEQLAISREIAARTCKVDGAVASAIREIELLRELRTRLVVDAVTGKIDTRGAATLELSIDSDRDNSLPELEEVGELDADQMDEAVA